MGERVSGESGQSCPAPTRPALTSGALSLPDSEGVTMTTIVNIPPSEEQTEISLGEVSKAHLPQAHHPLAVSS